MMADDPFQLRIIHNRKTRFGFALYQEPHWEKNGKRRLGDDGEWHQVVQVWGVPLQAVMGQVLATLKSAKYRPSDLSESRKTPFDLTESSGVRLGLLFLAVKPLRKTSRLSAIAEAVEGMADEEAYYWFSKVTDARHGRRSQKAFRILVAKE